MNGRTEQDIKTEEYINNRLLYDQPELIRQFAEFRLGQGDQATSTREYTKYVIYFKDYLAEQGKDFTISTMKGVLPMDITSYLATLKYKRVNGKMMKTSTSYRATVWSALNAYFKFLKANRIIDTNPMEDVKRAKVKDPIPHDHLESKEIKAVMDLIKSDDPYEGESEIAYVRRQKTKSRDLCIFAVFFSYGVRATCLCNMNVEDVNLEKRIVTFTDKGEKTFSRTISDEMYGYFVRYIADRENMLIKSGNENALFISRDGTRMTYCSIRKLIHKFTKAEGHELAPHALRKSFASLAYEASGNDIRFTQKALNHANINTTVRYINNDTSQQEEKLEDRLSHLL